MNWLETKSYVKLFIVYGHGGPDILHGSAQHFSQI